MRIETINIYRVAMPLVYPFRTAFGNDEVIESILVRFGSGDADGWGEASPWALPAYSPEFAAGAFLVLRDLLAPRLIGQEINSGDELHARLAWVKGNRFAKAALDLAWWDVYARLRGQPLWRLLGGASPTVAVGADFGIMDSLDELRDAIAGAVAAGFRRVKLKYRPGWELDMVRFVRHHFPDLTIHVDCNSAYTLDDLPMLRQLDAFGLAMVEQPLMHDDLIDHAALQRELRTPLCLDESITSPTKARQAADLGACGWVNIKPGRVGGLTPALKIHDMCAARGIPCWVGGMLESAVGAHHCIALATLPNFTYPADIFPSERFYAPDLSQPSVALSAPSEVTAPDTPGCGAEPDPERLRRHALESATLRA